ncbi:LAMI_0F14070g1_1 [Lachancea mirantina]|uniref:LAMI_0F14070g1_1 n=1 Tax=Lachancea mirantina TaxID=1230905 RepID=A0A1G4K3Z4_9SACH|nr:LAMI_0F14070g1_1 [Lachancea mirantina]
MNGSHGHKSCIVIGAGGVGVITAYSLFKAQKCQVSLIVRSDYDHVVQEGYNIDSCDYGAVKEWKPHYAYRNTQDAAAGDRFFDYIVVTTKNIPDGAAENTVSQVIRPLVESNARIDSTRVTCVVLVQNGIDIEKELQEEFDHPLALVSGVQLIASTKLAPGIVHQKGKDHLIVGAFDAMDAHAVAGAREFVEMYRNEGQNHVEFDASTRFTRWKKLLYNAAINTTTALVELDVPRCLEFAQGSLGTEHTLFRPAMQEIVAIAASEGITLGEQLIDFFVEITRNLVYKPSMCVDHEKGQLMEIEVIVGNPLRIAQRNGVPTPTLNVIYTLIKMLQSKTKEAQGLLKFDEKTARLAQ